MHLLILNCTQNHLPRHLQMHLILVLSLDSFLGLCVRHGERKVSLAAASQKRDQVRTGRAGTQHRSCLGTAAVRGAEGPTPSPSEGRILHYIFVPVYTSHKTFPTSDYGPEFKKCSQRSYTYLSIYNGNKLFTKQHLPLCTAHSGVFFSILFLVTLFKSWSRTVKLISWLSDGSQPAFQKTLPSANSPRIPCPLSPVALPLSW